jgi:hypothetical protein
MINWMYFPRNKRIDGKSSEIISVFDGVKDQIDSTAKDLISDQVLAIVRPGLESIGFKVEKGKKKDEKIHIPVLYGMNGRTDLAFDADAYSQADRYVVEVEAGRAVTNYQFLKDFFEVCSMNEADYLCIAVRNIYRGSDDFQKVCSFFDSLYTANRLGVPLKGILIIGY